MKFFKYHGAGNDFLLADNTGGRFCPDPAFVRRLCDRHTGFGADGVIMLESSADHAFRMVYFNPDGSGSMMCGNGGRCIVAFAADLGLICAGQRVSFEAPDGIHKAEITAEDYPARTVRLSMRPVKGIRVYPEERSCFLDTGARHLVKFVEGLDDYPVSSEGKRLRCDPRFAPDGTNVDFVETLLAREGGAALRLRTFEKGVEAETLACGTGIVAAALAAFHQNCHSGCAPVGARQSYLVEATIDRLRVEFDAYGAAEGFRADNIHLSGPAVFVGTVELP